MTSHGDSVLTLQSEGRQPPARMPKGKAPAAQSSALTVFPWDTTAEVAGRLRAAGGSLARLQFSGRHFECEQFAEIFNFLGQNKKRLTKLDSFLFPGVMLRDDHTFDLIFRFLRKWPRLQSVQFERGSFLSKKSIENSLLLPCRDRLSRQRAKRPEQPEVGALKSETGDGLLRNQLISVQ